jgi:4'-phosphopantetheinyl transferase
MNALALDRGVGLDLKDGDVHVWYAHFDDRTYLERKYSSLGVLAEAEIAKANSCAPIRRSEFLVSRWALRTLLTRYFPAVNPCDWVFKENEFGKPEIAGPLEIRNFKFNVSHSGGIAALAFGRCSQLGLDIEKITRTVDFHLIAESHFAPAEVIELRSLVGKDVSDRFFQIWTLKEAFIKALGVGLSRGLSSFAFRLSNIAPGSLSPKVDVQVEDSSGAPEQNWQFALLLPFGVFRLAVAASYPTSQYLKVIELGFADEAKRTQDAA